MRTTQTLGEWLREAPFSLAMSSGFFGFFAHCGALTALEDSGHVPVSLAGSSAGALVTGLWAAGLDATAQRRALEALRREDFWDPAPGAGLLRGALFRRKLEALLPVERFDQCRASVALSVYDLRERRTRVLREGSLAAAIHSSCALPVLFQPVRHEGRWLLDGGVLDRAGLEGIPPRTRVLHHHLSSRSPWRSAQSAALRPPKREGLVALVIDGVPRTGPFKLAVGAEAFERARAAAERALRAPVVDGVVRLSVD